MKAHELFVSPFLVNASEGIKRVEGASEEIKNQKKVGVGM